MLHLLPRFPALPCGSCMIPTLIPEMRSPRAFSLKGYRGNHEMIGRVPSRRFFALGPENLSDKQRVKTEAQGLDLPSEGSPSLWGRLGGCGPQPLRLCKIFSVNRAPPWCSSSSTGNSWLHLSCSSLGWMKGWGKQLIGGICWWLWGIIGPSFSGNKAGIAQEPSELDMWLTFVATPCCGYELYWGFS